MSDVMSNIIKTYRELTSGKCDNSYDVEKHTPKTVWDQLIQIYYCKANLHLMNSLTNFV